MADVFLSYKREDQQIAREVAADLEAEGFSVFFDVDIDVGDHWDERIERELDAAKAVVVLWSPNSRDSQWVKREAREAMARGILCPAMIARCRVPLEFSDVQAADIAGRQSGDYAHREWRRLLTALERCTGATGGYTFEPAKQSAIEESNVSRDTESPGTSLGIETPQSTPPSSPPAEGREVAKLSQAGAVRQAVFNPNGTLVVMTSHDKDMQQSFAIVCEPASRRQLHALRGYHPVFNEIGSLMATSEEVRGPQNILHAITGDNRHVRAHVWDTESGRELTQLTGYAHAFGPNGRHLVVVESKYPTAKTHMKEVGTWRTAMTFDGWPKNFSPDGKRFVTTKHGRVQIWDLESGALCSEFENHKINWPPPFSPNGNWMAIADKEAHTIRICDLRSRNQVATINDARFFGGYVDFAPDGEHILVENRVWHIASGRLTAELRFQNQPIGLWRTFSPDRKRIAAISNQIAHHAVTVWNTEDWHLHAVLNGHSDHVTSVCFSPDGERILTASQDGTARIWEVDEEA